MVPISYQEDKSSTIWFQLRITWVPILNIIKIHGSLSWKYDENEREILLSPKLEHLDKEVLNEKDNKVFTDEYRKKVLVVNPESSKFPETVLNTYYYELMRVYSNEMDRENSALFVSGFSMADKHIQEITIRAAKSNPTLRIFIFCYN